MNKNHWYKKTLLFAALAIFSMPVFAIQTNNLSQNSVPLSTTTNESLIEQANETLAIAYENIAKGKPDQALALLNDTIEHFQQRYSLPLTVVSTTYVPSESAYIDSYRTKVKEMNSDVPELSEHFIDLLYLKAYTLVEMQELKEAINVLNTAIAYDPSRANNYSELGHIYQTFGNWEQATSTFEMALLASEYSEATERITHRTRALRGLGYAAIEQGKLDIAESYYYQSLALDPNDEQAQIELKYIERMRERQ